MKALILAAGAARRLRPLTNDKPKCLLEVGGRTLLCRSIDALYENGIRDFVIVTGYLHEQIEDFVRANYGDVDKGVRVAFIHNAEYESTNNIYSLWLAREQAEGEDVLLLDSDLYYDPQIIPKVMEAGRNASVLSVSRHELGEEEMKVVVDARGEICEISKTCDPRIAIGESFGIELMKADYTRALYVELGKMIENENQRDVFYEKAFERLIRQGHSFKIVDVTDYFSKELDTVEDFQEAQLMARQEYRLEPVWAAVFGIYKEIRKICDEANLRVFGAYGTALGAVRHHGFIPWDDDFDVCMPRPDFEAFYKLCLMKLPPGLSVVSWRNCSKYSNLFFKVIVNDAKKLDEISHASGLPLPEGLFVDIFPIDGYPSSAFGRYVRMAVVGLFRFLMRVTRCVKFYAPIEWVAQRCPYETSRYATDWGGWLAEERLFMQFDEAIRLTPNDFSAGKETLFMDESIRVAANYDKYLRANYHDYMKLPPVEKRKPNHTLWSLPKAPWRLGPC